ncbi:MAG TPA: hypothetical protein VFA14_07140 [Herbaspirillum sp.]|nr:hypothetical protein [Herbaspirillum sp.]
MSKSPNSRFRSSSLPDSQVVIFRMKKEEIAIADRLARLDRRSRSSFIRNVLLKGIAEIERHQQHKAA